MGEGVVSMTTREARWSVGIALALALACGTMREVGGERIETDADAVWTERVDLRLDERFLTVDRDIEVQPISIGVQEATLFVRISSLERNVTLRTSGGELSVEEFPPYRIRLISTSIEPSATVEISRLR